MYSKYQASLFLPLEVGSRLGSVRIPLWISGWKKQNRTGCSDGLVGELGNVFPVP